MADYETARKITMLHEGGYANHKADSGGETMFGISRNNFPRWEGWATVDAFKNRSAFLATVNGHAGLRTMARAFYKQQFWDVFRGDDVQNQAIANEVFDTGVNCGAKTAVKFLQRAINATNKQGVFAPEVQVDGIVGPATLRALNSHKKPHLVFKALNALQGAYYLSIAERNKSQEVFMESWLSRVNF